MKTKIVYVVISTDNDIYLEQAWISAYSVKYYNPTAFITFVTDEDTYKGIVSSDRKNILQIVDEIIPIPLEKGLSNMKRSRWIKTNLRNLIKGDFLFIDTDLEIQIIAAYLHDKNFFPGHTVFYRIAFQNFPKDGILVAFHPVGHKIGVHQAEYIHLLNPAGNGGVSVHILQCQAFDCFLVPSSGCLDQTISGHRILLDFLLLPLCFLNGHHNGAVTGKTGQA